MARYTLDPDGYLHWMPAVEETCHYHTGQHRELRFLSPDSVRQASRFLRMKPCLSCMPPVESLSLLAAQRAS
jgi:hypothetical protein